MTAPRLPAVEAVIGRLAHQIRSGRPDGDLTWAIDGPATAGKSALLRMLKDTLDGDDVHAVLTAPPAQALDAGPMVLAEIAAGLKDAGLVNGQTDLLRDGALPLQEKIAAVRSWIVDARDHVILLFDEPVAWPDRSDQTEHFADHARLVIDELVRDIPCRRVIAGEVPDGIHVQARFDIGGASEPNVFLRDSAAWGPLAGSAAELADAGEGRLNDLSPLQLRLLVGHVVLSSAQHALAQLQGASRSRRHLSRSFLSKLLDTGQHADLIHAWAYLSHVRRPFASDLLGTAAGAMSEQSEALLRYCLLYPSGTNYVLHETLRRDIEDVVEESDSEHYGRLEELATYYRVARDNAEAHDIGDALPTAIDCFYYAARAGDLSLSQREPYFVDQLDMLGKTLSYELRRWDDAAQVFARAIALDEEDDYAHHYLAYNLDLLGQRPGDVERHYRRAIALNGRHSWWRGRLVCYLLTRGRTAAAREEWDRAIDDLTAADRSDNVRFYETLHGWVADLALRRGLLDFADSVVSSVPASVRPQSPRLTSLIRRLRAMQLAEDDGAFVPAQFLTRNWWNQGPFLLSRRIGEENGMVLRRWLAGRIDRIGPDTIELRVCEVDPKSEGAPRSASVEMKVGDFDRLSRDEPVADLTDGRFVEIGLYSDDDPGQVQRLIRVHADRDWQDDTLPLHQPTDRYWAITTPA